MKRTRPAAATLAVSAVAYAVAVFLLLPTILIVPMSFGPDQYLRFPPMDSRSIGSTPLYH